MIVADSSVWIDHLRHPSERFQRLLYDEAIVMHPFVLGELALGRLPARDRTLTELGTLVRAPVASHGEAMHLLSSHDLAGRGIGYVDLHLLASARMEIELRIWTRDRRLSAVADLLGVGFSASGTA